MVDRYYYFASSLPLLAFGSEPPQTLKEFLREARALMTPGDYTLLKNAVRQTDDPSGRNRTLREWFLYLRALKNELVIMRAQQKGWDAHPYLKGEAYPETSIRILTAELKRRSDPLTAEKLIDQTKWEKLEELSVGHYFDVDFLIIYALKLMILERWQIMDRKRGEEILEKIA